METRLLIVRLRHLYAERGMPVSGIKMIAIRLNFKIQDGSPSDERLIPMCPRVDFTRSDYRNATRAKHVQCSLVAGGLIDRLGDFGARVWCAVLRADRPEQEVKIS